MPSTERSLIPEALEPHLERVRQRRARDGRTAIPAVPGQVPETVITPPGRLSFPDLRGVVEYRALVARLAAKDITLRYRQTAAGIVWVIVQPLFAAGVLSVVFGRVAKLNHGESSYFLLAFAGTIWWMTSSQALTRAASSLVLNATLVTKVYLPRLVLPVSVLWSGLLDTTIASTFFVIFLLAFGPAVSPALLLAPVWLAFGLLLGGGVGIAAATAAVRYRDVPQILPLVLQLLLFASPVAYRLDAVPHSLRWVYVLNPATGLLEAFRWSTVGGALPAGALAWSLAASCLAALGGLLMFGRWERTFADVI
jgi:lipopolysaccharide transport system permease protein